MTWRGPGYLGNGSATAEAVFARARAAENARRRFRVRVNGVDYLVEVEEIGAIGESAAEMLQPSAAQRAAGAPLPAANRAGFAPATALRAPATAVGPVPAAAGRHVVKAPMPGVVRQILVAPGDQVSAGTPVAVLSAMKMENEVLSDRPGVVAEIPAQVGAGLNAGDPLVVLQALPAPPAPPVPPQQEGGGQG